MCLFRSAGSDTLTAFISSLKKSPGTEITSKVPSGFLFFYPQEATVRAGSGFPFFNTA